MAKILAKFVNLISVLYFEKFENSASITKLSKQQNFEGLADGPSDFRIM